ncbi:MAG: Ldh family oxidoreductase [Pseudomonadota bacterium]
MAEPRRFAIAPTLAFMQQAFEACGVPTADAATIAKQMIEADLTGFDAHGIFRLSSYCENIRSGRINPKANIKIAKRAPATALIDGDNGMGHLIMTYAANIAVEIARESGIGWVGVRRSNHAGAAGVYAEIPVKQQMVGIYAAVSTANHMAPWGGAEALIGTNPLAVGIPAGKEPPIVLDIATSVSSFGSIRQRLVSGEPMPDGWVVHSETGQPINDPKKVGEGVLLPIGGYKGSGLALIIGLLAGVLNSAAFGRDVIDFTKPGTEETNTGQFIAAIDVSRFLPPEVFAAEVDRHMRDFKSSKRLPGVDAIRMPGEDRRRRRAERSKNGVALPDSLLKQLDDLAAKLSLTPFTAR